MEIAFLRARLDPVYRDEFLRILASKLRNEKVNTRQFVIDMYVKYICLPQAFAELECACDSGTDCEVCQRVRELFTLKWFPIVETWKSLAYFAPQQIPLQQQSFADIYQEIENGNYALAIARANSENVKALCKKLAQLRQWRKSLRQWFPKSASQVNVFLISCAIQLLDPRPDCDETDYCYTSLDDDMKRVICDSEIRIRLLSAIICSAQIKFITSLTFGRQLVDAARKNLGDVSFESEIELTRAFAPSCCAIICDPLSVFNTMQAATLAKVAALRIGTNICFCAADKRYFVVNGPIDADDARRYANIAGIARQLHVPRSNDAMYVARDAPTNTTFIAMHLPYMANLACMDEPNLLETIELMTDPHIILTRLRQLHITLQMGDVFVNVVRAYVLNCLWHFVMNVSVCGSASTDILVSREGRIFSFNEYPHHSNGDYTPGGRVAHSDVMSEFTRDVVFYSTVANKWAQRLRGFAQLEAFASFSQKWRERARATGITAQYLFACAERAQNAAQIWTAFK